MTISEEATIVQLRKTVGLEPELRRLPRWPQVVPMPCLTVSISGSRLLNIVSILPHYKIPIV